MKEEESKIETKTLVQLMSLCEQMTTSELESVMEYVFKLAVAKSYEDGKEAK